MVSSKSVQNVLRMVWAGKEEVPAATPAPTAPEAPAETTDTPKPESMAIKRYRYYFFDAPATKSIPFKDIGNILKSNDVEVKTDLIDKLKGGNTGKFSADYFRWLKLAVVTNQYSTGGKGQLTYEVDLNSNGTKVLGKETITPTDLGVTVDTVEKELLLFSDKMSLSNVINIDTSSESRFINSMPPANMTKLLQSGAIPPGEVLNYEQFKKLFDNFRVWMPTINQLVLPSLDKPRPEDGQYAGGQAAYNAIVAPVEKQLAQQAPKEPQKPSLGEKQEEKSVFEPVTQKTEPVKGEYLDTTPGGIKMANDVQYKKSARNVVLEYLKKADYSTTTPATQTQTTGPSNKKPIAFPLGETVQQSMNNKANMEKAIRMQKDQEKLVQQTQRSQMQPAKL